MFRSIVSSIVPFHADQLVTLLVSVYGRRLEAEKWEETGIREWAFA